MTPPTAPQTTAPSVLLACAAQARAIAQGRYQPQPFTVFAVTDPQAAILRLQHFMRQPGHRWIGQQLETLNESNMVRFEQCLPMPYPHSRFLSTKPPQVESLSEIGSKACRRTSA